MPRSFGVELVGTAEAEPLQNKGSKSANNVLNPDI
jgi:hypothetical protein